MPALPERLMIRGKTFYCRICVPAEIATSFGRKLVVKSLRTQDLRTAKQRLARATVDLENQFEAIRAAKTREAMSNEADLLHHQAGAAQIVRSHGIQVEEEAFAERVRIFEEANADPRRLWKGEIVRLPTPADFGHGENDAFTYFDHLAGEGDLEPILGFLTRWRLGSRIGHLKNCLAVGDMAEHLAIAQSKLPRASSSTMLRLARQLVAEEARVLQQLLDGEPLRATEIHESSAGPTLAPTTTAPSVEPFAPQVDAKASVSLDELFSRWETESEPSASTLSSWRGIVRHLREHLGRKAANISSITADDIVSWKDKLVASKKSAATISNGYLACARALFRFAVTNKLLDADPADGVKLSRKAKAGKKMLGYDRAEVERLLGLSAAASEPWKRWLPWLAAATGSRIGEVAQLHGSHIFEQDGMTVVRITPARDAGTIKNPDSERTVPLHSALIDQGFLEFVRSRGEGPLFYNKTSGDPKRKHASKSITNRLAGWIRDCGFRDKRKAPNHALRHWFKSEAARLGIEDSLADAIQGHVDGRSSAGYRHFSLDQMSKAVEKIDLSGISQPHGISLLE